MKNFRTFTLVPHHNDPDKPIHIIEGIGLECGGIEVIEHKALTEAQEIIDSYDRYFCECISSCDCVVKAKIKFLEFNIKKLTSQRDFYICEKFPPSQDRTDEIIKCDKELTKVY